MCDQNPTAKNVILRRPTQEKLTTGGRVLWGAGKRWTQLVGARPVCRRFRFCLCPQPGNSGTDRKRLGNRRPLRD
ncbi:MAG: hypothetical protein BJ554DRAFT_4985 [Olpidium bornovanus]|uniref:Uncharacterized protein n=1 Tax=Olpidium bornovanus TaxID=278681 RepID=A0A8H7ZLZ5_9FUNG|nr:MAG: hypothetical protein BJ554DRAFT_4985 [Olpidium bornovanus]